MVPLTLNAAFTLQLPSLPYAYTRLIDTDLPVRWRDIIINIIIMRRAVEFLLASVESDILQPKKNLAFTQPVGVVLVTSRDAARTAVFFTLEAVLLLVDALLPEDRHHPLYRLLGGRSWESLAASAASGFSLFLLRHTPPTACWLDIDSPRLAQGTPQACVCYRPAGRRYFGS